MKYFQIYHLHIIIDSYVLDLVKHCQVFKVYELGIHGKRWRIFWNIYQNMESGVVVNGVGSRKFKMKR
jgi:hypothetical protein